MPRPKHKDRKIFVYELLITQEKFVGSCNKGKSLCYRGADYAVPVSFLWSQIITEMLMKYLNKDTSRQERKYDNSYPKDPR